MEHTIMATHSLIYPLRSNNGSYDATFYLGVYGALIGVNACFRLLQSFMFANGRINASITIHQNLLDSIFRVIIKKKTIRDTDR